MTYKETGFRALYKSFAVFKLKKEYSRVIEGFPGNDNANYILTYGYIDHDAGFTMEIIAAGSKTDKDFLFNDTCTDHRAFMRIGSLENEEYYLPDDDDEILATRYSEKISILETYNVSEDIERSRNMEFLDELRSEQYPDDLMVYLTKEGNNPEGCWIRIEGLGNRCFYGRLLNEPYQDFGCHEGDKLNFYAQQTDDNKIICFTDTAKDIRSLEEGQSDTSDVLKEAVRVFNSNRNQENFVNVFQRLNYSYVWVPCNAVLSEKDQEALKQLVEETGKDVSDLIGDTFTNSDDIRMVPDILENDGKFFFPVFSSAEEMGEYGEHFSKIEKRFIDVIPIAKNNEKEITGIVLNAFSDPFFVDRDLFDAFKEFVEPVE